MPGASPRCGSSATSGRSTCRGIRAWIAAAARAGIYNDLPAVSFASGEVTSDGPDDCHRRRGGARCWQRRRRHRARAFNLAPITLDRPFFYAVLRLDQLGTILKRLEILPQAEIGALVNLAVLAQAVVIAVAGAAGAAGRAAPAARAEAGLLRPIVYFPALGLGFLFIEIFLIEKASLWLNDRTVGLRPGADRHAGVLRPGQHAGGSPRRSIARDVARLSGGDACVILALVRARRWRVTASRCILATLGPALARPRRALLVLAVLAPVSLALGLPFPLGLTRTGTGASAALGLGAERRVLCGRHATRQPDCARGGFQPGSALRRDAVCGRAGDVSRNKEEAARGSNFSTITRRGVISAAGAFCLAHAVACRVILDARRPMRPR